MDIVQLQKMELAIEQEIDRRDMQTFKRSQFEDYERHVTRSMVKRMSAVIYGETATTEHVIRFPENWLEALKERFAPSWLRDRYPVKFTTVTASLRCTYPDFKPSLPDQPYVVNVAVYRSLEMPIF